MAIDDPVDKVSHGSAEDERKTKDVGTGQCLIIVSVIKDIENQKNNNNYGDNNKNHPVILEQAKCDPGIILKRNMKNILDYGDIFPQRQLA